MTTTQAQQLKPGQRVTVYGRITSVAHVRANGVYIWEYHPVTGDVKARRVRADLLVLA